MIFHIDLLEIPSNDERKRAAYRQKITECIDRAEKLKDLIQQEKDLYVPSLFTMRCSNNYIVIVRNASHGIAQILGSCSYIPGDCIIDAMNSITCLNDSNKIFVSYNLTNQNIQSQRGFAFLYHLLPRLTTITLPSTRISTSLEFGLSPVSTMISQTSICVQQSIPLRCNTDYSLVLHKIDLAVSKTGICNYSPDDCFEEPTYLQGICGGKSSCYIFPPLVSLSKLNNFKSTYFYAEYQCIPNRPKLNISIYSLSNSFEKAEGDPIFSSFCYTSEYKEC
ncbi:unnamed protein product [Rotaria sordida]|uniref:SUEL-type lectin domain-containing protein n=1 Tax=Rotaria sordida TaxID=392033 RepID=A0A818J4V4_9BILA|nr:unnamed protein product [Rotaria sordida]